MPVLDFFTTALLVNLDLCFIDCGLVDHLCLFDKSRLSGTHQSKSDHNIELDRIRDFTVECFSQLLPLLSHAQRRSCCAC